MNNCKTTYLSETECSTINLNNPFAVLNVLSLGRRKCSVMEPNMSTVL